jgi:hypothetical protein
MTSNIRKTLNWLKGHYNPSKLYAKTRKDGNKCKAKALGVLFWKLFFKNRKPQ